MEFLAGLSHPELSQFLVRLFSAQVRHSRGQVEVRLSPCSAHWALCPVHGCILHAECFPWKFPRQPSSCRPGCLQGWGCYREWFSSLHKNTHGLAVALPPVPKTVYIRKPNIRLLWWSRSLESTCQCRRHRFSSRSKKIPHALDQLSLSQQSRAHELQLLKPTHPQTHAPQQENHHSQKPSHSN